MLCHQLKSSIAALEAQAENARARTFTCAREELCVRVRMHSLRQAIQVQSRESRGASVVPAADQISAAAAHVTLFVHTDL